jgi:hypothetical protein
MRRQQPIERAPVRLTVGAEREGERRQQTPSNHAAGNDGRAHMVSNNGHNMNQGGPKQPIRRRGNIY